MTQQQLEREVASATGETLATIHRIGFSLVEPEYHDPLIIDWDEQESERPSIFPARYARNCAA
jgi:hypothetical protein